jgi:TolA-binding protein
MANRTRNQPGEVRTSNRAEPEINPLDTLQEFYERQKQTINTITTVILVAVVGYFAYTKLYKGPNEDKASTAMYYPQLYFSVDSLNLALNGDGQHLGFTKIAKKYDGTSAGNLAHYYEGICFMQMGDFKSAIKSLKDFNGKGTVLGNQAYGLLGECYLETGDQAKAIESFKKATADKEDGLNTPTYLYQLGIAYETSGNANEAKAAFKRIRDDYPRSIQARDIDKELAKLGEVND